MCFQWELISTTREKLHVNNDQAANKGYVDGNFVTKNCATFCGDVDITNKKIVNLAISTSHKYVVNKLYVDTNTVKLSSFTNVISKFPTDW